MKDTNNNLSEYCPPSIKAIEINFDQIICVSGPFDTEMLEGDDNW